MKKLYQTDEERRQARNASMRRYYARNKEKVQATTKRCTQERGHLWPSKQRNKCREYERKYDNKLRLDPVRLELHRATERKWRKRAHAKIRQEVMSAYGGKCVCCSENNLAFLTLDHVNNDGAHHRAMGSGKGTRLYRWARKHNYPATLQILCWNCNLAKHQNGGVCPHQRDEAKI